MASSNGSRPLTAAAPAGVRDHRIDFYRGIALAMIFVNHVPGTVWEHFTSRNFGFSDSAELFVFLAGFASAFAYGRAFVKGSAVLASLRALRRAGVLYMVHILLMMLTVAVFAGAALVSGDGRYLQEIGIGHFMMLPVDTLLGVATLGHQLAYVNILPMYSALLLALPLMLLLVRRFGLRALLAASVALWIACGVFRFNLPNHPNPGGWHFNPFAWQLIFAIGLACGFRAARGETAVPFSRPLYGLALSYLAFAYLFVGFELWGVQAALPFHFLVQEFDKTFVTLPRLLHLLALVYVFAHAPAASPLSRISGGNAFAALGRHSLAVFAVGTMLAMACNVLKLDREAGFVFDTVLLAGGLSAQFALAFFLDWHRAAVRQGSAAPGLRGADAISARLLSSEAERASREAFLAGMEKSR